MRECAPSSNACTKHPQENGTTYPARGIVLKIIMKIIMKIVHILAFAKRGLWAQRRRRIFSSIKTSCEGTRG